MCGICGIINFENNGTEHLNVKTMMSLIKHRGPDDEGVFNEDGIALGFVRLSILDLSPLGHQPMISEDGNYVLIYNGEVYNYIELREELITKGYVFKSKTDTEVVLNAFIEWGESCLDRFNGMWSFAIYNRRRKELFCARDRYGVKPFYYFLDDQQFIFASEIPSILAAMGQKGTPNNKAIYDFLVFNRTDQTEDTFFKEIKKLQHGHFLRLEITERRVFDALNSLEPENRPVLKKLKYAIKKWYDLKERVANSSGFGTVEAFREIFTSAIGLRLRSDVPVGICLSGGLDSSSILSMLLKKFDKRDMNSFSAVYGKGKRGDESEFIDEFKKDPVKMHFSYPTVDTLIEDIDKFVKAHAEPLPTTSPYAQYKVMEMAKKDVVVVLDGQGADESLAGYHYFFGFYFHELFRKFEWIKLVREIFGYLNNHYSSYGLKIFWFLLLPPFIKKSNIFFQKGYLQEEFASLYSKQSKIIDELYSSENLQAALFDHFEHKLEHLLKWEDRNSMFFSIESRVPFLDYRLVEKTLASVPDMKIKNGITKSILREAMKGILPEKIRLRKDKIGFSTPEEEWFINEKFQKIILDILNSESFKNRKIVDVEKAKQLYKKHINREIQISGDIWKWINLELWFRAYID